MTERKKLIDILRASTDRERLERAWTTTKAADELKPLPAGVYRCRILSGELFNSKGGTPGYKLVLEVAEGEHAGRRVWHDIWLTAAALPMAKRDLAKLGIEQLSQLERPLPAGLIVDAKVALRKEDDGNEFNRLVWFNLFAVETPEPDPFAPQDDPDPTGDGFDWSTGQRKGEVRGPMKGLTYGFRVVGGKTGERRLVDHQVALTGYADCNAKAEVHREAYLSHFIYPVEFYRHLKREGSEKGYNGVCGADWLYWDVDRPNDPNHALRDARKLVGVVLDRYRDLDEDDLLIFLSGGKGFHVGLPTALWQPESSTRFHDVSKRFALAHAERAGVVVDGSIYSKTRLFRAPNSRHPSGRHKRRLMFDELMHKPSEDILALATEPEPFELPTPARTSPTAAQDWAEAAKVVEWRTVERRATPTDGTPHLNALTLAFIRDGSPEGERALRLFQGAANLAEFGCAPELAHALLTEPALDSGLTPSETRRQIDSGLAHARRQREENPC